MAIVQKNPQNYPIRTDPSNMWLANALQKEKQRKEWDKRNPNHPGRGKLANGMRDLRGYPL